MTKLSVNINKIATLRNARGENNPNLLRVALDCELFGAEGITVHPRPDERHIRYKDVYDLRPLLKTEMNIEGYPTPSFIDLILKTKPAQVTLVPDAPDAITSNAGWDIKTHKSFLTDLIDSFKEAGVRTSLFVDTNISNIEMAADTHTDRIELYTEPYARLYPKDKEAAVRSFVLAAEFAKSLGIGVNAGHDLSLENLSFLSNNIPFLEEVSIGHALICDALYKGLEHTIKSYKSCLK
ncbi:pyridoxine 5'-phosphate synthase [Bacteroidales bacterium]|nr:pyridoxine 5'-phosphate synthase [Bacteroidales bacterium]